MDRGINVKKESKTSIKEVSYIGLFVALIAICSWISIPFAVPFTMQTFAVILTVALLGPKLGTISVCIYLALGAVGVPVFSGMTGGLGKLFGMTGGYLLGFVLTTLVTGTIIKIWGKSVGVMAVAMALGIISSYIVGTMWFMIIYPNDSGTINLYAALSMCVFPFIVPDICKIMLAITAVKRLDRHIKL